MNSQHIHAMVQPPPSLAGNVTFYTAGENSNLFSGQDAKRRTVVFKVLRLPHFGDTQKRRINQGLLALLAHLHECHPNIVYPEEIFLDLSTTSPILKMPLFFKGNIIAYLTRVSASSPVSEATRLRLIAGISDGLSFLHQRDIVHGNIRGSNVLINRHGHAVLVDIAISITVLSVCQYFPIPDNIEWMAPELFTWNDHDANHLPIRTKESDVYAFARTVEEISSLQSPFAHIGARNRTQMVTRLKSIILSPQSRRVGMSSRMWDLFRDCLAVWPHNRPTSSSLRLALVGPF